MKTLLVAYAIAAKITLWLFVEAPFGMDDNSKTTAADLAESKAVFAIELVRKGELR